MPRYSREAKLEMIRLYHEEHRSVNWIAEHYGISQSYLRHLLEMDAKGMAKDIGTGQSGKPKGRYSGKFKLDVVKEELNSGAGYREVARKYGINHVVVMKWERIYLLDGEAGLLEDHRGKTVKEGYVPKQAGKLKLDKDIEQDLIAEIQQLRMENEYLKKLQALVRTEERSPLKPK